MNRTEYSSRINDETDGAKISNERFQFHVNALHTVCCALLCYGMFSLVLTQANPLFTSRELFQATTFLFFFSLQLHNIVKNFKYTTITHQHSLTRSHDQMIVSYSRTCVRC